MPLISEKIDKALFFGLCETWESNLVSQMNDKYNSDPKIFQLKMCLQFR